MPTDPLKNLPAQEKHLFDMFTSMASGQNLDVVMGVCINVLINAVRQNYATRESAEQKFNELFGRGKEMLLANHYDTVTGRRRTVIPHTQVVRAPYMQDEDITRKPNGR